MKTRALAEGAILAALAAVLGIMSVYVPFLSMITSFLWPLPIVVLIVRQGMGWGVMGVVVVAAVVSMLASPLDGILLVLSLGGVGLWYGYCLRKSVSPLFVLGGGAAVAALSVVVRLLVMVQLGGVPLADMIAGFSTTFDEMIGVYQQMGMLDVLLAGSTVEAFKAQMLTIMETILPAAMVISSMVLAWISYALSTFVLRRLGHNVRSLPPFSRWHLPWVYLWGLIIAIASLLGYHYLGNEILMKIGVNLLYIYLPILVLCGISLLIYMWKANSSGHLWLVLVIVGCFMVPPYAIFFFVISALIDSVFDLRAKIEAIKEQAKNPPNNKL